MITGAGPSGGRAILRTMGSGTASGTSVLAARRLVADASHILGFTGAGISTESGVPDFRSPGGVWAENRIVDFQEFLSSEEGRIEYWRQKAAGWPAMRDAQPNAGHNAFFELHRQGRLDALITQNIDGCTSARGCPPRRSSNCTAPRPRRPA